MDNRKAFSDRLDIVDALKESMNYKEEGKGADKSTFRRESNSLICDRDVKTFDEEQQQISEERVKAADDEKIKKMSEEELFERLLKQKRN